MGHVYRAVDTTLRRPVALKFLAANLASDEEYRARFLREARIAASLNHPNTCVVYEVGETDAADGLLDGAHVAAPGTPFIAMELIEGDTLATRLALSGPLPADSAVDIALQIAEGLAEAHSRQIIHRDLKPQNVMITPSERVKIVDFGLAKPIQLPGASTTVSTSEMISADMGDRVVIGTCAYMSPEQAAGRTLDARSDVFAFGIMLYQTIAGRLPFQGDTATETLAKILEADPVPLPDTAGVPQALEQFVWRCLQKEPDDRYPDAAALLKGLRAIAEDPAGATRAFYMRGSVSERTGWASGRRVVLAGAVLLVFLAVYVMVRGVGTGRPKAQPPESAAAAAAQVASEPAGPSTGNTTGTTTTTAPTSGSAEVPAVRTGQDPSKSPRVLPAGPIDRPGAGPRESLAKPSEGTPVSTISPSVRAGTLTLTSVPRASVSLDGNLTGITPLTLETGAGTHEVVLTGPDGLRWRGRVEVAAGQTISLHRDLSAVGTLSVVSNVWAEVGLDEAPAEQTPIHFERLAAGLHRLRVTREGYVTQDLEIFIEEGRPTSLRVTLEKER